MIATDKSGLIERYSRPSCRSKIGRISSVWLFGSNPGWLKAYSRLRLTLNGKLFESGKLNRGRMCQPVNFAPTPGTYGAVSM